MTNEHGHQNFNQRCATDCSDAHCEDCTDDIEVVELEDENGDVEEFVILEEVDFEDRHFVIMAPLAEVQAYSDDGSKDKDKGLSIEIFEVNGDDFAILEDEVFAKRLLTHLEEVSVEMEESGM